MVKMLPAAVCMLSVSLSGLEAQESRVGALRARESQIVPRAVQQQNLEFVVPELIIGGEWTSTIRITNRLTQTMPRTNVYLVDNLGNPMSAKFQETVCGATCIAGATVTDVGFFFTVNPGGIVEVTFSGGANTQFGQAIVDICGGGSNCSSNGLYVEVTLRNRNPTRPDFESVFPLEQPAGLQYMMWDHRNGADTVLYLVNDNGTNPSTVLLQLMNGGNQVIDSRSVSLVTLGAQILDLAALFPKTIGLQGTLIIQGQGGAMITATGLRINPSNSFTPLRTYVPSH